MKKQAFLVLWATLALLIGRDAVAEIPHCRSTSPSSDACEALKLTGQPLRLLPGESMSCQVDFSVCANDQVFGAGSFVLQDARRQVPYADRSNEYTISLTDYSSGNSIDLSRYNGYLFPSPTIGFSYSGPPTLGMEYVKNDQRWVITISRRKSTKGSVKTTDQVLFGYQSLLYLQPDGSVRTRR